MKKKNILVLAILLMTIGFAAVSTTLFLNGNTNVASNTQDFDIIFTKAVLDGIDMSKSIISSTGKEITFKTKELKMEQDFSKLNFTVANKSRNYDAKVTVNCNGGEKMQEYYKINVDMPDKIIAQTLEKGSITVTQIKSTIETIVEEFTCRLDFQALEKSEYVEEQQIENPPKLVFHYLNDRREYCDIKEGLEEVYVFYAYHTSANELGLFPTGEIVEKVERVAYNTNVDVRSSPLRASISVYKVSLNGEAGRLSTNVTNATGYYKSWTSTVVSVENIMEEKIELNFSDEKRDSFDVTGEMEEAYVVFSLGSYQKELNPVISSHELTSIVHEKYASNVDTYVYPLRSSIRFYKLMFREEETIKCSVTGGTDYDAWSSVVIYI